MANYELRRRTGQTIGSLLGSMWGQAKAERSLKQLESDMIDLRSVADKNNMSADEFEAKLSSLYSHHGVRPGPRFDYEVGRRKSTEFAKALYPDKPLPSVPSVTGPAGGWPTTLTGDKANQFRDIRSRLAVEGWENDVRAAGDYNREQGRMRTLMSKLIPQEAFDFYTAQQAAEAKNK